MVSSRNEELMTALINGEDVKDYIPRSRNEQFLKDCAVGSETTTLEPRSRSEMLLSEVHNKIKSGGGFDIDLKSIFDQTKNVKYFFNGYHDGKYTFFYYLKDLNNLIKYEDTSNVTNMSYMFNGCSSLTTIPNMNTSKVTDMGSMFTLCSSLTTVPSMDTSNVTNMRAMFNGCSSLTTIPNMNTSKVTDMGSMFNKCSSLITIPNMDTSNITSLYYMFNGCSSLTTVPNMDTSKVTSMSNTFKGCSSLTTVPNIDTSKVTYMESTFDGCSSLTTVPSMDISNVTSMSGNNMLRVFYRCYKLEYLNLLNVKVNIQIGSGSEWGHLIQKDCLIQIISELIKPSSGSRTLTMGTANTAKLADTYVKLLEDDGTGKYPFELCESTDEGAMTITDYCLYKNWQLA